MATRRRVDPLTQLAASVRARETTEIPWALLRHTYLVMKWNPAALRRLNRWAEKNRIVVTIEPGEAAPMVRFTVL